MMKFEDLWSETEEHMMILITAHGRFNFDFREFIIGTKRIQFFQKGNSKVNQEVTR